ncbi:hypothetical protein DAD186_21320 [Dermabacter vaginalis]|uniref:Uncharacterized protein n=1 Tax=Dermabacter vaginalis TaxID=1630135 RepID=A0A1B0ZL93_9MICO|nr:hypothetical protein DAD186_21320 [Dermabacter vaginalis]
MALAGNYKPMHVNKETDSSFANSSKSVRAKRMTRLHRFK